MEAQVYWNLHKDTWSVRRKKPQKVMIYAPCVIMEDCSFTVQKGGRAKVLATQQKNVHAWVNGKLVSVGTHPEEFQINLNEMALVVYNPYKMGSFYRCSDMRSVCSAWRVVMWNKRVYI